MIFMKIIIINYCVQQLVANRQKVDLLDADHLRNSEDDYEGEYEYDDYEDEGCEDSEQDCNVEDEEEDDDLSKKIDIILYNNDGNYNIQDNIHYFNFKQLVNCQDKTILSKVCDLCRQKLKC